MEFWNTVRGAVLDDKFVLNTVIQADLETALFATALSDSTPANVRIYRIGEQDPAPFLAALEKVRGLQSPEFLNVYEAASTKVGDENIIYVVFESAPENLGDALSERALDVGETTQIAQTLVSALKTLHANDLVHGHVEPAGVFAIGDKIKLRSDCIQARSADPELSFATDVYGLGATLFEALTQRKAESASDPAISQVPAPFSTVISNCLAESPEARWSIDRIQEAFQPTAQPAQAEKVMPLGKAVAVAAAASGTVSAATSRPATRTPAQLSPRPAAPHHEPSRPAMRSIQAKTTRRVPVVVYAVAVIIAAILVLWLALRPKPTASRLPLAPSPIQTAQAPPKPSSATNTPVPAATSHVAQPTSQSARATPAPANVPTEAASASAAARPYWRVIAYTYSREADAQSRADQIKQAHPELNPEVFSPDSGSGPYLVALGGRMTADVASLLRRKAIASGLPRDTYTQNFSH